MTRGQIRYDEVARIPFWFLATGDLDGDDEVVFLLGCIDIMLQHKNESSSSKRGETRKRGRKKN